MYICAVCLGVDVQYKMFINQLLVYVHRLILRLIICSMGALFLGHRVKLKVATLKNTSQDPCILLFITASCCADLLSNSQLTNRNIVVN